MALTIAINASTLIICSNVNLHVVIITYSLLLTYLMQFAFLNNLLIFRS